MPTRLRPELAAEGLEYFRAQTYGPRELVIVDDETGLSFPDGVEGLDVHYCRRPNLTVGTKRNIAVALARGAVVIHWDSDDWYSTDRIEHQVDLLVRTGAELVGYYSMRFDDLERGDRYMFDSGGPGHVIGTSFCYWRSTWEKRPFPDREEGEDHLFAVGRRIVSMPDDGRIIARIHDGNTCDKRAGIAQNRTPWRKLS